VHNLQQLLYWLADHRLGAAAVFFGGAAVAVILYTYVVDYRMQIQED